MNVCKECKYCKQDWINTENTDFYCNNENSDCYGYNTESLVGCDYYEKEDGK